MADRDTDRDRDREPSSSLHDEAIEIESEVNNNATIPIVIGEPSSQDYDFQESVIWTHNYFRKCEDSEHAIRLTCEAENLTRGPNQVKKKEKYSTTGWRTAGRLNYLSRDHVRLSDYIISPLHKRHLGAPSK